MPSVVGDGADVAMVGVAMVDMADGGYGYGGYGYGGYAGCGYGGYGYGGWGYPAGGYMPGAYPAPGSAPTSTPASAPAPAPSYGPSSGPAPTPRPPASYAPAAAMNTVVLDVTVPSDARVVINDLLTTSTGEHRRYMSRDLQPGSVYRYQVRAEYMRDGKTTTDEQTVELTAGDTRSITLGGAPEPKVADAGTAAQREL